MFNRYRGLKINSMLVRRLNIILLYSYKFCINIPNRKFVHLELLSLSSIFFSEQKNSAGFNDTKWQNKSFIPRRIKIQNCSYCNEAIFPKNTLFFCISEKDYSFPIFPKRMIFLWVHYFQYHIKKSPKISLKKIWDIPQRNK